MLAAIPSDHDDDHGGPAGRIASALGSGTGAELRRPLGISIVGGLIVSQALTLFTTPVVYLWFDRLAQRFSRHRVANPVEPEARRIKDGRQRRI